MGHRGQADDLPDKQSDNQPDSQGYIAAFEAHRRQSGKPMPARSVRCASERRLRSGVRTPNASGPMRQKRIAGRPRLVLLLLRSGRTGRNRSSLASGHAPMPSALGWTRCRCSSPPKQRRPIRPDARRRTRYRAPRRWPRQRHAPRPSGRAGVGWRGSGQRGGVNDGLGPRHHLPACPDAASRQEGHGKAGVVRCRGDSTAHKLLDEVCNMLAELRRTL